MNYLQSYLKTTLASIFTLVFMLGSVSAGQAHCDRINGPVATDARKALETGDISHALIWITDQQAEELKSKFEQSLKVYTRGGQSQELAERYFMSETVRLHREAEGMPFTGLKPAQSSSKDIQVAEKALTSGKLAPVNDMLANEIRKKTSELYTRAMEAKSKKDNSVEAGRRWVDAYVQYIVYVHKLYQNIQAGPAHGVGE
ncbi:hypothetical protein SAMN05443144_11653 [Fodinibius roseus]|uniref:DUF4142 domain-containing protein n=1 Tax=Fodinibius roseus TaxID=1194090 RepID=A0A1M5G1W3_9BACT|nr:DUF6448 family protein [Fodinibius roseus]SHF97624.1 hypothetical protein SAMN05443144_11653 [Fodinibius roseus]